MTRTILVATCLLAIGSSAGRAQDAVKVDPEHHQVLFENEQVRVVRMVYPPGYKPPMHGHLPGVSVTLSSTSVHSWQESGEESDGETEAGAASWSEGRSTHQDQVTGETPLELVRVEIKKKGTEALPIPSHDAVKVDPEHRRIEVENDQVRVVRAKYPAGYEAPLHNHLPGIAITLTDRRLKATYESGRTSSEPVKKGHVSELLDGSEPHRTKNIGSSTAETIRVELKTRP